MLSSGGTEPKMVNIGGAPPPYNSEKATYLYLSTSEEKAKIKFLKEFGKGAQVIGYPNSGVSNPIQDGTTVLSVDCEQWVVELSKPLLGPSHECNFGFIRPMYDYAANAMIRLWYSWAQYFRLHWRDENSDAPPSEKVILASINSGETILRFSDLHPELEEGMVVRGPGLKDLIPTNDNYQSDALIQKVAKDKKSVTLSQKAKTIAKNQEFFFLRPTRITGSIEAKTAVMNFQEAHTELVKGMEVQGPGLDEVMTEVGIHQGNALILEIASDYMSVTLSQLPNKSSNNAEFIFLPPQKLKYTPISSDDSGYPLFGDRLNFENDDKEYLKSRKPYCFAQKVYMIMASMNQIGYANNDNVCKFMQDVVGANMGFIFDQAAKDSADGQMVIAMIRDMIKSVLRGVSDFTKFPDLLDEKGHHLQWYPDPAEEHGGQPFNVFNLDPFVWFVHEILGFSGYGFSVDDDTANVGAGGATQLQITVGGPKGLKNTDIWTVQAPYGPVENVECYYSGHKKGATLYNDIKKVSLTTPIEIVTKVEHHLANNDLVCIDMVEGVKAINNKTFKIGNVKKESFVLLDQKSGNPVEPEPGDSYSSGGRWSYPLHPYIETGSDLTKVFHRVSGDDALGTFQGTLISVNGVETSKEQKVRVWRLGAEANGQLLINTPILLADGKTFLSEGEHSFSFFGPGADRESIDALLNQADCK